MNQDLTYFALQPNFYAALFDKSIIILDSKNDNYLSLIDDTALALQFILSQSFTYDSLTNKFIAYDASYNNEELNDWITYFIEQQLIVQNNQPAKKINSPLKTGGLIEYQWDTKPTSWKPFKQASIISIVTAFYMLAKIHYIIKYKGIQGVLELIKIHAKNQQIIASEQDITTLAAAIDAASLLYPKKTFCLAWSATFVILASKKNWRCNFVIGVQTNPFYAHAWAETPTKLVVHDDPHVAEVLSIILKEPIL